MKKISKGKTTNMHNEVRNLIANLIRAGIPPEYVGAEFMAHGAALIHQKFGSELLEKQCASIVASVSAVKTEQVRTH